MTVLETYRGDSRIRAVRRGCEIGQFPILFGDQTYARGKVFHRGEQRERCRSLAVGHIVLAALLCEQWPEMSGTFPRGCPWMAIGCPITVTVSIVAMPARTARRVCLDGCIDHGERINDRSIVERFETEAHQFQEARVDHGTLIERWTTIAYIITDCRVRITRLR